MVKRNGIVRAALTVMGVVLAVGLVFGLAACGKSDESLVRAQVTQALDVFKNPSLEKLTELTGDDNATISGLEEFGIDGDEFLVHSFKHFDYKIKEVTVDGEEAKVTVTVTNADLQAALTDAASTFNQGDIADLVGTEDFEQQVMQRFIQAYYEKVDASDNLVTNDVELTLTKADDAWQIDESSISNLSNTLFGGASF